MSDIIETFWQQFAVETEEHFELIEPLLVAAESQPVDKAGIAQLFRSFHSIKGLARAMDLRAIETLSHHSETLLGLVRDGRADLSGPIIGLLLQSLDVLKALQGTAIAERADAPLPTELIHRLEQAAAAIQTGGAVAATPAAAPAPIVVAPPEPPPAPAEAAPALHEDQEMLSLFAEMLGSQMPAMIEALARHGAGGSGDAGREAAESLAHAASVMQFDNIADLCDRLSRSPVLQGHGSVAERREVLGEMRFLANMLGAIEADLPTSDAQAARLLQAVGAAAISDIAKAHGAAGADLQRLENGVAGGSLDDQQLLDLGQSCRELHDVLLIGDSATAADLFLLLEDGLRRAADGEALPLQALIEIARGGLEATEPLCRPDGTLAERVIADLTTRLHEALLVGAASQAGDGLAGLTITPDLVRRLSPEQMAELTEAATGKRPIYELTVDLERDTEFAGRFLAWMQEHAKPLNNRNIVVDGVNWFHFLVISGLDPQAIASAFKTLDPQGQRIRVQDCRASAAPTRRADAAGGGERPAGASGGRQANIMRVPGEVIDRFMARIGEIALVAGTLSHAIDNEGISEAMAGLLRAAEGLRGLGGEAASLGEEVRKWLGVLDGQRQRARGANEALHGSLRLLQEGAMELRVVPIDSVFNRFPRLVRDLAQAQGKQITLELRGQEVRIDKGMVETLLDPLMHMVRNAVDHGIEPPEDRAAQGKPEQARLVLDAVQRGNRVLIEIADDGRGINTERVREKAIRQGLIDAGEAARLPEREIWQFIFSPGFSTAAQITETSGRGVGMDVVMNNVTRLGGSIRVDSTLGRGSRFTLDLPLSAAIQDTLLVKVNEQIFALPDRYVAEVHAAWPTDLQTVSGRRALLLRGEFLPIYSLAGLLGHRVTPLGDGALNLVVLSDGEHRMAVAVDRLVRRQELFVKDIHPRLAAIPGIGGASILGDGGVVLILDGDDLFRLAENSPHAARAPVAVAAQ